MILSPSDKNDFFPDLEATGGSLLAAIAAAQIVAEGPLGSNQKLELSLRSENIQIKSGLGYLSQGPIPDDGIKKVEVRSIGAIAADDGWGRGDAQPTYVGGSLAGGWEPVTWEADTQRKEIRVTAIAARMTPLEPIVPLQARVEYMAGLDFAATNLPVEAIALKSALGQIVTAGASVQGGVKAFRLNNFYEIEYQAGDSYMNSITQAMQIFRAYRNRNQ